MGRVSRALLAVLAVVVLAACSGPTAPAPPATPATAVPAEPLTILAQDRAVPLALATSALLYRRAPVVVLAAEADAGAQARAATAAETLGAPLLLTPTAADDDDAVRAELRRLGAESVLPVGEEAQEWAERAGDVRVVAAPADPATPPVPEELASVRRGEPLDEVHVLANPAPEQSAAAATARAAGAQVYTTSGIDPRGEPELVTRLAAAPPAAVVALGSAFGDPATLSRRLAVARTGVTLPGGGQLAFPGRRMVALYGNPTSPLLGALGEQGMPESVARAQALAAEYQPFSDVPVVPAFEIITTVASTAPGPDGDFSNESEVAVLRPYVDAARAAGMYVVLDLQPGRADFLTQARRYAELLAEPHVGLALDPEWRLGPNQRHLAQIGSVGADEVNAVVDWLALLVRERSLPQKVLVLHQFRTMMISDRARVDTGSDEVAVLVHADGFGAMEDKLETWAALRAEPLAGARWGWKNFYDEDRPTPTPQTTLAVSPEIVFVSYQ
jgi:hypothetical protein